MKNCVRDFYFSTTLLAIVIISPHCSPHCYCHSFGNHSNRYPNKIHLWINLHNLFSPESNLLRRRCRIDKLSAVHSLKNSVSGPSQFCCSYRRRRCSFQHLFRAAERAQQLSRSPLHRRALIPKRCEVHRLLLVFD